MQIVNSWTNSEQECKKFIYFVVQTRNVLAYTTMWRCTMCVLNTIMVNNRITRIFLTIGKFQKKISGSTRSCLVFHRVVSMEKYVVMFS